jgi:hypothetical protein
MNPILILYSRMFLIKCYWTFCFLMHNPRFTRQIHILVSVFLYNLSVKIITDNLFDKTNLA